MLDKERIRGILEAMASIAADLEEEGRNDHSENLSYLIEDLKQACTEGPNRG